MVHNEFSPRLNTVIRIFNSSIISLFLSFLVAYVIITLFSLIDENAIKSLWQIYLIFLWCVATVSGVAHLVLLKLNRVNGWIYLVDLGSNHIIWACSLVFIWLGLLPRSYFIPDFIFLTPFIFWLTELYVVTVWQYDQYILKSLYFAIHGARFALIVSLLSIVFVARKALSIGSHLSLETSPQLFVSILEIVGLGLLAYMAWDININNPRKLAIKTVTTVTVVLIIISLNLFVNDRWEFWWIAMMWFLSSVFYVAHKPNRRLSTTFMTTLYVFFAIFIVLYNMGVATLHFKKD